MLADGIYECRIQGDACPPTLKCLKQEDGAYACRCEKKGYVVKGDGQERTCEGMCSLNAAGKSSANKAPPCCCFRVQQLLDSTKQHRAILKIIYNSMRKQPSGHLATLLLVSPPRKSRLGNEPRNFILMKRYYPYLSSASDWLNHVSHAARPIKSTTQIWVVTRNQYGISEVVSQTSFGGESSGNVAKCRLFLRLSL